MRVALVRQLPFAQEAIGGVPAFDISGSPVRADRKVVAQVITDAPLSKLL
jgi:hypothetical protein